MAATASAGSIDHHNYGFAVHGGSTINADTATELPLHKGNLETTVTGDEIVKLIDEWKKAHPGEEIEDVDFNGGHRINQTSRRGQPAPDAKGNRVADIEGNLNLRIENYGKLGDDETVNINVTGGSHISPESTNSHRYTTSAAIRGDLNVELENVHAYDSDVMGGHLVSVLEQSAIIGRDPDGQNQTIGANSLATNVDASVKGTIRTSLKNSTVSFVNGASMLKGYHQGKFELDTDGNYVLDGNGQKVSYDNQDRHHSDDWEGWDSSNSDITINEFFERRYLSKKADHSVAREPNVNVDISVGNIEVVLENTNLLYSGEDGEEVAENGLSNKDRNAFSALNAGNQLSSVGGNAAVNGDINVKLNNSKVGMIVGGGTIFDQWGWKPADAVADAGVKGNINIDLKDAEVLRLVAGSLVYVAENDPNSKARVDGDIHVTLSGAKTKVEEIFLAGWGSNVDVEGKAIVDILDKDVKVDRIYGVTGELLSGEGVTEEEKLRHLLETRVSGSNESIIRLGNEKTPYVGAFNTVIAGVDTVIASEDSKVQMDINERTVGDWDENGNLWLSLSGDGEFSGKIELVNKDNVRIEDHFNAPVDGEYRKANPYRVAISAEYEASEILLEDAKLVVESVGDYEGEVEAEKALIRAKGHMVVKGGAEFEVKELTLSKHLHGNFVVDEDSEDVGKLVVKEGGEVEVDKFVWKGGRLILKDQGTLETKMNQIGLDNQKIEFQDGSLVVFDDDTYTLAQMVAMKEKIGAAGIQFEGDLVGEDGKKLTRAKMADLSYGTHEQVSIEATGVGGQVAIDNQLGGKNLQVGEAKEVTVSQSLTLVGDTAQSGELVTFDKSEAGQKINVSSGAQIAFGQAAAPVIVNGAAAPAVGGKLSTQLNVADNGKIVMNHGNFTLADVALDGNTSISAMKSGETVIEKLSFADNAETVLKGSLTVNALAKGEGSATIRVGTEVGDAMSLADTVADEDGFRGDLKVTGDSLQGLNIFLDPVWKEGQDVTSASRLIYGGNAVDGNIVVGHNSYAVLNGTTDEEFLKLFREGRLAWGAGGGQTLAGLYVAGPISVTTGSLTVDQTKRSVPSGYTPGKVHFAADSVLVGNVSALSTGEALITGTTVEVADTSKAVILGMREGITYTLAKATGTDPSTSWAAGNITSGDAMWRLDVNPDGTFGGTELEAREVFTNIQGYNLLDAAYHSDNAAVNDWAHSLTGAAAAGFSKAQIGALFDAAFNPSGATATAATALDRANELRRVVRDNRRAQKAGAWVAIVGEKAELEDAYTGLQGYKADTDSYGVAFGGEAALADVTVGAGLMFGNGKTETDAVFAKNDFDFYALTVYGKSAWQGIDLEADASVTLMKSDLTVGGLGRVDTDTDTTVYSLGLKAQKAFDLGVEVTPFVAMDVYHVRTDGYSNGQGAAVDDADATVVEFPVGTKVAGSFTLGNGLALSPEWQLAVVPTVGDRDFKSTARLGAAANDFSFTLDDDLKVRTKLGLSAQKANVLFGLNAGYEWGSEDRSSANLTADVKILF